MASSLECLPNEILSLIIAPLHRCDLKLLRLTALRFGPIVDAPLFESITIAPYKRSFRALISLTKQQSVAPLVKTIVYDTRRLDLHTTKPSPLHRVYARLFSQPRQHSSAVEQYRSDYIRPLQSLRPLASIVGREWYRNFESKLLCEAFERLVNLENVRVTDGNDASRHHALPLSSFHLRMLAECRISYGTATFIASPLEHTSYRSAVVHLALRSVGKLLRALDHHLGESMWIYSPPWQTLERRRYGVYLSPHTSLRSLKVHLAWPKCIDMQWKLRESLDELLMFLGTGYDILEEFELDVFPKEGHSDRIEKGFKTEVTMQPAGLQRLRSLMLGGISIEQDCFYGDTDTALQGFLKARSKTIKNLRFRNLYLGFSPLPSAEEASEELASWPELIVFLRDHMQLKSVRFEGRLWGSGYPGWYTSSWDAADESERCAQTLQRCVRQTDRSTMDQCMCDMHENIYQTCLRRRIERYILHDPEIPDPPLQIWRLWKELDGDDTWLMHVHESWMGDWSWRIGHPKHYVLCSHRDGCGCEICEEALQQSLYALSTGAGVQTQ